MYQTSQRNVPRASSFIIVNSALKVFHQYGQRKSAHTIEDAAPAIFGHNSAHSLATGPVMAEPFISPLLLTITPALSEVEKKMELETLDTNYSVYTYLRNRGNDLLFYDMPFSDER